MPIIGDSCIVCGISIATFLLEYDERRYLVMIHGIEKIVSKSDVTFNSSDHLTSYLGFYDLGYEVINSASEKVLQAH